MRAVLLDGTDAGHGPAAEAVHGALTAARLEVTHLRLRDRGIALCCGCFGCWLERPGECLIDDDGRTVARAVIGSDVVVLLSEVTFGGYSPRLKAAIERLLCLLLPTFAMIDGEVHHRPRYRAYPRLLGIGIGVGGDSAATIFADLVGRNARNLLSPSHAAVVLPVDAGEEWASAIAGALARLGVAA
jgi:hypothetical protein